MTDPTQTQKPVRAPAATFTSAAPEHPKPEYNPGNVPRPTEYPADVPPTTEYPGDYVDTTKAYAKAYPADVKMTVTFTGDPSGKSNPEKPEYGGKAFPKGEAVEVDAAWLAANPNIRNNNHFKVD